MLENAKIKLTQSFPNLRYDTVLMIMTWKSRKVIQNILKRAVENVPINFSPSNISRLQFLPKRLQKN